MKPVLMFMFEACPHCQRALSWMKELKAENPRYCEIDVNIIDERLSPDVAAQYDYYYVPTYFIDGHKLHEGAASKETVRKVFEAACE